MATDDRLRALLREHRDRYWVHYGPDANSDHGPMVYLALAALGASIDEVEAHARRYVGRLTAQRGGHAPLDAKSYRHSLGRIGAYPALIEYFDREIATHGVETTLHQYLPELASGWVRDAFHALIRLGYGIEFSIATEVAAGLAYLAAMGPDPRLDDASRRIAADEPLGAARARYSPDLARGSFAQRYEAVITSGVLADCLPDPTDASRRAARAALGVFDSTHGFFALHLVTSSHAMRVCAPFIGPAAGRLLWAGTIAGYLCIGAPPPRNAGLSRNAAPDLAIRDPEHLPKLAYTALSQARAFDDPEFTRVVAEYLDGTDPRRVA